jgi:hypothetical protein
LSTFSQSHPPNNILIANINGINILEAYMKKSFRRFSSLKSVNALKPAWEAGLRASNISGSKKKFLRHAQLFFQKGPFENHLTGKVCDEKEKGVMHNRQANRPCRVCGFRCGLQVAAHFTFHPK